MHVSAHVNNYNTMNPYVLFAYVRLHLHVYLFQSACLTICAVCKQHEGRLGNYVFMNNMRVGCVL